MTTLDLRDVVFDLIEHGQPKAARRYVFKYCQPGSPLVDEVVAYYLAKYDRQMKVWTFLNDDLFEAYRYAPFGPSLKLVERILAELIRQGWAREAQRCAETYLHRQLTPVEVEGLLKQYIGGGVYGDTNKKYLADLAAVYISRERADEFLADLQYAMSLD